MLQAKSNIKGRPACKVKEILERSWSETNSRENSNWHFIRLGYLRKGFGTATKALNYKRRQFQKARNMPR